jgi:hypothetical protein
MCGGYALHATAHTTPPSRETDMGGLALAFAVVVVIAVGILWVGMTIPRE